MKLVTFCVNGGPERIGAVLTDDRIVDLKAAAEQAGRPSSFFDSMLALIQSGEEGLGAARHFERAAPAQAVRPLRDVKLCAPIPRPPRMRVTSCFPRHLRQAAVGRARILSASAPDPEKAFEEAKAKVPQDSPGYYKTPTYWWMDHFCVSGPDDQVKWPRYSDWVDYELELVAVIGKGGKDIGKGEADDHIFGYTILNDLSARDAQFEAVATGLSITAKGKDFDGGYALGPCIVTKDSIDIFNVKATLRVNGEEWGSGHSSERHWTFADAIAYMSQDGEMIPGEVISSATVSNCSGMENARKGRRGDVVELDVEGIGTLRTRIV